MKKAIITSALPYANGEIHIGHIASTYLPADITTRFLKQKKIEAYYICASDDFGTPILIQSEIKKKDPNEYVEYWNKQDHKDFSSLNIQFDFFYKTSSIENTKFVQYVFKKLYDAGHIYNSKIIQAYCETDKKFLPDRYVIGECPYCKSTDQYSDLCEKCGRIIIEINNPKCAICGNTPIKKTTKHYFFRLSSFSHEIEQWLKRNKNLQKDIKKYVQNWIKNGLEDWDITRDISWGIKIPLDNVKNKVFYGWFDNHLAYISSTMKFFDSKGINGKEFWNSAQIYHFIGKDIVYHHYLFLPAIRLGISEEYKLPDYIPTRGHLKFQSKKLSKSHNWYISIKKFVSEYPADYLRFYLIFINRYSQDDLNFDWTEFAMIINSELIGKIGNLINRVLKFIDNTYNKKVPVGKKFDNEDIEIKEKIKELHEETDKLIQQNNLDKGLKKIIEFASTLNKYFQHKEPWKNSDNLTRNNCMYISINAIRCMTIALYSFLPWTTERIWLQLGLKNIKEQTWDSIRNDGIKPGHIINDSYPLFSKVKIENIKKL